MPSGAFCSPIPVASDIPFWMSPSPNPTPTARPSGKLWMVIANTNSQIFGSAPASTSSRPLTKCRCGSTALSAATAPAPAAMPAAATKAAATVEP